MSTPDDPLADLHNGRRAFLSHMEALLLDWLSGRLDQREFDAWRATWTPQEQEWARQWGRALE